MIQYFPTTILWVHFVKFSAEHVSNTSLATPKCFQGKIQIFQSKESTKLLTESHDMIEKNRISEISILFSLKTEFLTSKS